MDCNWNEELFLLTAFSSFNSILGLSSACAKFGKHYTDVNAEAFWMVKIARLYHEQAKKTGAIIVPACGATSVPLDLLAWLSVRHLKTIAPGESAGESVSAANAAGGVSGGSWDTLVSVFSEVPKGDLVAARGQYSFSPGEFLLLDPLSARYHADCQPCAGIHSRGSQGSGCQVDILAASRLRSQGNVLPCFRR
jgi:hypothetical protein